MQLNLSNNKNNESANVQNAAPVNNPKSEPVMHEVDVIGLMTSLNKNGKAKLSDHFKDAEVVEPISETPAAPAPAPKQKVTIKRKVQLKKNQAPKETKADAPAALAKYSVQEYTTKKGGTAFLLFGFESMEHAEKVAAECSKTVSATWRYGEDGSKRFCLSMGTRYGDVARELCAALNKGDSKAIDKACAKSHDVYAMAVAAGKAEREIRKQERMAAKEAETKEEAAKEEPVPAAKTYTTEEVAAMLREVLSGKELPKDIEVLMAA